MLMLFLPSFIYPKGKRQDEQLIKLQKKKRPGQRSQIDFVPGTTAPLPTGSSSSTRQR
jgi:hypothetical protein